MLLVFRTRLNVSLVQRRYKKSKVKKNLSFKQIKDNKHEHFSVLTHITLF